MRQHSSRANHRNPALENLEPRLLLSAAAQDAALLADGYVPTTWKREAVHAKPGEWIIHFAGITGSGVQQLARIDQMIGTVAKDVHATQWLGSDGLVLAESAKEQKKNHWTYKPLQAKLNHLNGFDLIEPNLACTATVLPNDPFFNLQWGLDNTGQNGGTPDADIDAPEAWNLGTGNGSVVVGVIDSGIDYTHPDLSANIWTNPGEIAGNNVDDDANGYIDDIHGWDFANHDNDPFDDNGHGTHVAGTIGAVGNNGLGVTGVAWNVKLMALKFISSTGSGATSDAIAAINYATNMRTDHGINVRVTNNSWGGSGFDTSLQSAINSSGNVGILFVAAAGNNGTNNDTTPTYPASFHLANEIVVAATDHNDQLASFSNYGANTVDIAAPGVDIASTYPGNQYVYLSGTSMAAPHVSGVAALAFMLQPAASVADVKAAILNNGDPIASLVGKTVTGRRLNAYNTLANLTVTPTPTPTPTAPAAPTNLTAAAISRTQVRLSWIDRATNEDGFQIYYSTDGVNFSLLGTVGVAPGSGSTVTVTVSGLLPSTRYYFEVRAYNATGVSAFSNVANTRTPKR